MSIANDYQNVEDYSGGFAYRKEPIPPDIAAVMATALLDLAERAKLLERVTFQADEHTDA